MWSIRNHLRPKKTDNNRNVFCFCRYISDHSANSPTTRIPILMTSSSTLKDAIVTKVHNIRNTYEDFIGVKDVQAAHTRVMQAEEKFIHSQEYRRNAHKDLVGIQDKLRELRSELDRIPRGNEKYLDLVTKEINVMREEKQYRDQFEDLEKSERSAFNELSSALRFSHEKEKAQNEKTKYWSVMGSLLVRNVKGAFVGIVGTSINSRMKIHQLQKVMEESAAGSLAHVQEQLNTLFREIEAASKIKVAPVGNNPIIDISNLEKVESKMSATVNLLTQQIDEFNQRLQTIQLDVPPNQDFSSSKSSHSSVIIYDDVQVKRNIQYATITILICVPLITKMLGAFFGD